MVVETWESCRHGTGVVLIKRKHIYVYVIHIYIYENFIQICNVFFYIYLLEKKVPFK